MANWWESIDKNKNKSEQKPTKKALTTDTLEVNIQLSKGESVPATSNNNNAQNQKGSTTMADKVKVTMENGSILEFGAKQKMLKNTVINEDGSIVTTLDFANGKTLVFTMPVNMIPRFAAHGADQKCGDVIAGVADVDDCYLAAQDLTERLLQGEWSKKGEGGGFAGTSILSRALVELGHTPEKVKAFLADKTQAQKIALRGSAALKPIIERLEAEKASKGNKIDTEALLGELDIPADVIAPNPAE